MYGLNLIARVVICQQESDADAYDTENGIGHTHDEWEEVSAEIMYWADVQDYLDGQGLGQWDGGNTAYDPDGSHFRMNGTVRTRWARIERFAKLA